MGGRRPGHRRGGRLRHQALDGHRAAPDGPGSVYSNGFFLGGDKYKGPYTDGDDYEGITVDGQDITIKMAKPFPEMDYWGTFAAMGPVPLGEASEPPDYGLDPLATGPYKVKSFTPNQELVLERNDQWDPDTDPARHQFADEFVLKFDQNPETTDETDAQRQRRVPDDDQHDRLGLEVPGGQRRPSVTRSGSTRRPAPPSWRSQYQGPNASTTSTPSGPRVRLRLRERLGRRR